MLSIGLMSGTSMDGIDVSLLDTDGEAQIQEIAADSINYSKNTKILLKSAERAFALAGGDIDLARYQYINQLREYLTKELAVHESNLDSFIQDLTEFLVSRVNAEHDLSLDGVVRLSTLLHAKMVNKLLASTNYEPKDIDVVGYHGQTMYHNPSIKSTIQIGDGYLLSKLTGIKVVCSFRNKDVGLGGQGAPFAPIYHRAIALRDKQLPVIVANCGGISNLSVITSPDLDSLTGFDAGPGNGLIDAFIRKKTNGREAFDKDGKYGLRGRIDDVVLKNLFAKSILINGKNFFQMPPPKALDIRDMQLLEEVEAMSITDGAATLEAFTADAIVDSLELLSNVGFDIPKTWVLAGGGFNNPVITKRLKSQLNTRYGSQVVVNKACDIGWNSKSLEAQIFAYLAVRSLKNLPISVPGTTGVKQPATGGTHYFYLKNN